MKFRFNINGDLWYAMLDHVALISYDYIGEDTWTALTRSYRDEDPVSFTVYKMDHEGIFHEVEKWEGREPLLLKKYKKMYCLSPLKHPYATPKPPRTGEPVWFKGMSLFEFEEANGARPITIYRRGIDVFNIKDR